MRLVLTVLAFTFVAIGCSGGSSTGQIRAFNTLDPCTDYDESGCTADDRCQWIAIGAPCVEGEPCQSGVCQQIDPCRGYTDEDACAADTTNHCGWAATELCPADSCGDGGYCYQITDEQPCACACPVCEPGQACPPCECSCPSDDCVCSGTACPDNDPSCVPEYDCSCPAGDGGGCGDPGGGVVPPEPL